MSQIQHYKQKSAAQEFFHCKITTSMCTQNCGEPILHNKYQSHIYVYNYLHIIYMSKSYLLKKKKKQKGPPK